MSTNQRLEDMVAEQLDEKEPLLPERKPYRTYVLESAGKALGELATAAVRATGYLAKQAALHAFYGGFPGWYQDGLEWNAEHRERHGQFSPRIATTLNALLTAPLWAAAGIALLPYSPYAGLAAWAAGTMEFTVRLCGAGIAEEPSRSILLAPLYAAYRAGTWLAREMREFVGKIERDARARYTGVDDTEEHRGVFGGVPPSSFGGDDDGPLH